jgi:preprotein translocase subunit SecD
MKIRFTRFNTYLLAGLVLLLFCACTSAKKKKDKDIAAIGVFLEMAPSDNETNHMVPIGRSDPVYVNIEPSPFIDQRNVESAKLVKEMGTFSIQVKFDNEGMLLLEGVTTENRNRHFAIQCIFDQKTRWLAAPLIRRRITDGILTFAPDASEEEANQIVKGLTNAAKKYQDKKDDF